MDKIEWLYKIEEVSDKEDWVPIKERSRVHFYTAHPPGRTIYNGLYSLCGLLFNESHNITAEIKPRCKNCERIKARLEKEERQRIIDKGNKKVREHLIGKRSKR